LVQIRNPGQPDFFQDNEHCVLTAIATGDAFSLNLAKLVDVGCSVGKKWLCEVNLERRHYHEQKNGIAPIFIFRVQQLHRALK
jgi:hypothetical protein